MGFLIDQMQPELLLFFMEVYVYKLYGTDNKLEKKSEKNNKNSKDENICFSSSSEESNNSNNSNISNKNLKSNASSNELLRSPKIKCTDTMSTESENPYRKSIYFFSLL